MNRNLSDKYLANWNTYLIYKLLQIVRQTQGLEKMREIMDKVVLMLEARYPQLKEDFKESFKDAHKEYPFIFKDVII